MFVLILQATQTDNANCKLRASDGIDGISRLDPGLVTGPLSAVCTYCEFAFNDAARKFANQLAPRRRFDDC
jgi:hypothetical protein